MTWSRTPTESLRRYIGVHSTFGGEHTVEPNLLMSKNLTPALERPSGTAEQMLISTQRTCVELRCKFARSVPRHMACRRYHAAWMERGNDVEGYIVRDRDGFGVGAWSGDRGALGQRRGAHRGQLFQQPQGSRGYGRNLP